MTLARSRATYNVQGPRGYADLLKQKYHIWQISSVETTTFCVCINLRSFARIQRYNLESANSLWLRETPGERLSCELSAANTPSSWKNECVSPEGGIWATHHSIHYRQTFFDDSYTQQSLSSLFRENNLYSSAVNLKSVFLVWLENVRFLFIFPLSVYFSHQFLSLCFFF